MVGVAGSGKTVLAARLARRLGIPHVELDALHWGPGWAEPTPEDFRARVAQALRGERWVADGNYGKAREVTWGRANTLVWLDYPLAQSLGRLFVRTVRRIALREVLWNGNRETLRGQLGADSLFPHAVRSHARHRTQYPALLQRPEFAHLKLIRLRSPRGARRWLESIPSAR